MTNKRAMELLNQIIDYTSIARDTEETISELLHMGFSAEELCNEFAFGQEDIDYVLNDIEIDED